MIRDERAPLPISDRASVAAGTDKRRPEDESVTLQRVEVTILNQAFTFMCDDEERIRRVAELVDRQINEVARDFGIVNTLNSVIMAMMRMADNYMEMKERFERVEDKTLKLLKKVENVEIPCGVRDEW